MMNRVRTLLALGVLAFFSQSALAVNAVFDPTVKQKATHDDWTNLEWTNTVFWTDTDGQPLAACPQTAADSVSLTNYYNYGNAQVYLGQMKEAATPALTDWEIGTLVGPVGYALLFPYSHNYWLNASKARRLTVGNPDGFKGLWGARSGRQELVVQPTETYAPALSHVEIDARMIINVPSHAATVESLDRFGALEKSGSGDLRVTRTDGDNTKIYVEEGSVTLAGTVADAPVAGAALHLDASLPDVFETEEGGDGQTHVTLWKSALGPGGVSAGISSGYSIRDAANHLNKEDVTTPVLSGQKSSTDLTLLDFSANTCAMTLSQPITGIRQVFYVASRSNMNATILGSSNAGEYPFMANGGGTSLFSRDYAAARFGYIEANGTPVSNHVYPRDSYSPSSDNLILVSVEMPAGVTVRDIGTERYYTYSTGCAKIGEILIYTRTLTATERKQVTDYLMRKWFAAYSGNKAVDAENAVLVGENASIGVSAGAKARVNGLGTHGSKVTKTGDGDLVVRSVGPAAAALDIRGGTVKFAGPPEGASDAAPADDPYCWLTADAGYDETSYTDDAGRLCVTNWADCRGANGRGVYATVPTIGPGVTGDGTTKYFSGKPPYVRQAADNPVDSNGHAVMRFTYEDASTAMENLTWMWLMPHGTAYAADPQAYDGFIVYRQTTDDSNLGPFGSCDQDLMRYNKTYLFLSPSFGAPASYIAYSARWTLDGVPVDPCGPFVAARHGAASGYHVAAVSSDTKLPLDYLAKDRIGSGPQGKMEIGEFIIYDRKLTALERRNTEAYLLKKWLRREHPDKSPTLAKTIYGTDVPAVVDTDAPAANLGAVEGGNGTLVKRGTGPLALRTQDMSASGLETLKVEAGALTLQPQFDRDAAFHVDASDRGNFGLDAEGKVQDWYDVNGNCTASATINGTSTRVRPSLKTVTINGVEKTVVDFGDFTRYKATDTSGMRETSAGMKFDRDWKDVITEAHIVARTVGLGALSENASFFTYTGGEVSTFLRGAGQNNDDYKIFNKSYALAYHGQVMLDGAVSSGDARVGTSSFVTLTSVPDTPCSINSICMDRGLGGGGLEIAEIIAFTNASTAVRANYVHNYLRKKWFGADVDLEMTNHYASIEVATGATLNASGIVLDVQSVGGAGTVNAEAAIGVSALSLAFDANGAASAATTLTCPVAFDGPVTVDVSVAVVKAVQAGVYPVITAPTIGETDVSAWTIEADETLMAHRVLSLVKSGNTLSLKVDRKGMAIIVR